MHEGTGSMHPFLKNAMGVVFVVSLLGLTVAAMGYVKAYKHALPASDRPSLSSTGTGKAVAVPDIAEFSYSVVSEGGTDLTEIQQDNTTTSNAVVDYLKESDIDDKDIRTTGYNVSPRYDYGECSDKRCPPPSIVGYTVTQTVAVRVREFDQAGTLLAGVVSAGANSVSDLNFTVDDEETVKDTAREEAIESAKERAKSIAKTSGVRLGRILSITETPVAVPYPQGEFALGAADSAKAVPSIEAGSQEFEVEVTITYEIR